VFYLSEDTRFIVECKEWARPLDPAAEPRAFWQTNVHTNPPRFGRAILAGARVVFEPVRVERSDTCFVTIGTALPRISADGLVVSVSFRPSAGDGAVAGQDAQMELARKSITSFDYTDPWAEIEVDLGPCCGKTAAITTPPAPAR
jgi:hypothetical protein